MPLYCLGERRVEFRGEHHYVAPGAALAGSIVLEHEASIWFGVVIRAEAETVRIGARTNVQDGSVLHVDPGFPLTLGREVTVGHQAMLHGCSVGDGALVGIGSIVLNGARIGAGSLIGANTLIPEGKQIPEGVLVIGSPGKIVRELTAEERAGIRAIAASYVERSRLYRAGLREQPLPPSAR
jgi:carbonic anhydrase/acetyltransferase-like protein (isoleucine patch superfamily)